mgnify:CR=1 FL=1
MKNIYFKFILLLTVLAFPIACSEGDKLVDGVFDDTTSGAFLRTIKVNGVVVSSNVTTANLTYNADATPFTLELEAQDNQNGALLDKVDISLSFVKNNAGSVASINEKFWKSIPASAFTKGSEGLPRMTLATTLGEIRQALVISPTQYSGGDQFKVTFRLFLKDGRMYTYSNSSSNVVGGAYMRSPFVYSLNVVCPITESLAGTHTYVSTNMFRGAAGTSACGPTSGTVVWTQYVNASGTAVPGELHTSDFSFGMYGVCWGDPPATTANGTATSARVVWFCNKITTKGVDFYSDSFTYTMVSVVGPVMTLDWINGYGDRGRVAITRQGGANWPTIFQN